VNAFIDTNVLLDVLAKREPFYEDSAGVWTLTEQGSMQGLVSTVTFTNIFYVMRRWGGARAARRAMVLLRDAFMPVPCDAMIINQAIDGEVEDFEDAVQYYSALHASANCILSRDPACFPRDPAVPVLSPSEFLARLREGS